MGERAPKCPICAGPGVVAHERRVDPARIGQFTYSSRKTPELMHDEYLECRSCRILYASGTPDHEDLVAAYRGAAFDASEESRYAANSYLRALRPILRGGVHSVLDVGCGDGGFLLACRGAGVQRLQGIEPSPAAAAAARDGIEDVIFDGPYEEYRTGERFDLVTLFQTIEHLRAPLDFLRDVQRLVNPGGCIAVACHDYLAPVNRLLGQKSPILDLEHLQIFSATSIRLAMQAAGLSVVSVKTYSNTYPLRYWLRLAPVPAWIKNCRQVRNGPIGRLPLCLPIGNLMAVGRIPA